MSKSLVIFGTGDIAEVAHYYFSRDTSHAIAAFTVDRPYLTQDTFKGLPVVPFDEVAERFEPGSHEMFVALSYAGLNELRKSRFVAAKALGYRLASYLSSRCTLLNDGRVGENCFILENNVVQPFAVIGDNVTLWSGNHIGHHSVIGDHTFIASHVVVSGGVQIGESCFIGVNATLRDHIRVGDRCIVGAGAVLLADAEPEGVYVGEATPRARAPSSRIKRI